MDIRGLRYFLAISDEGTLSSAAKVLHVTQPTLSRQMSLLEKELGKTLFLRGHQHITLTEDGRYLRERAHEIVKLADRTEEHIRTSSPIIEGDVYIGCGETEGMRLVFSAARAMKSEHPNVTLNITSGDSADILYRLDSGLFDYALLLEQNIPDGYDSLDIPADDVWGLLVRRDHALAGRKRIKPSDLDGQPLICSKQALSNGVIHCWLGMKADNIKPAATYNLAFNGALMVEEGLGVMLCYNSIVNTTGTDLTFIPLSPAIHVKANLAWKSGRHLSRAALALREYLESEIEQRC